jgi:hypothetical protein
MNGRRLTINLAALAIMPLLLGLYAAAYVGLGTFVDVHHWPEAMFSDVPSDRHYSTRWQVAIFQPAGRIESWLRGYEVEVKHADDTQYELILGLPSIDPPLTVPGAR